MTSIHHRDGGAEGQGTDEGPRPVSRLVTTAGALTSLALIAGLAVWGYRLAVRDVTGVPVIRALEGPARLAPEEPGGDLARHLGLSVNDVAALGTAAAAPDQVVLAPRIAELSPDDLPMTALRPLPRSARVAEAGEAQAQDAETVTAPATPDAAIPVPDTLAVEGVAPLAQVQDLDLAASGAIDIATDAQDPAVDPAAIVTDIEAEPTVPEGAVPASVPGVSRSPRPMSRPLGDLIAQAAALAVADAMASPASIDIDPADLAQGTRLVQLGAFDSAEIARAEWDKVAAQFAALMVGKRRVIQAASSGGRTFYRLRVEGFDDVADARRFCAALVAEQTNCIPALVR
ncbi:SPOR domain-containing protein [Phaeovulum sp.]|uniref:SPOR domain-containing protein n=1 Tax=Phaeovulum sp. TaxID=2934796 RepID=UPI0039E435CA